MYVNDIIIAAVPAGYCVAGKADIPKCGDHADAS
jgi:hypothetical protein